MDGRKHGREWAVGRMRPLPPHNPRKLCKTRLLDARWRTVILGCGRVGVGCQGKTVVKWSDVTQPSVPGIQCFDQVHQEVVGGLKKNE